MSGLALPSGWQCTRTGRSIYQGFFLVEWQAITLIVVSLASDNKEDNLCLGVGLISDLVLVSQLNLLKHFFINVFFLLKKSLRVVVYSHP